MKLAHLALPSCLALTKNCPSVTEAEKCAKECEETWLICLNTCESDGEAILHHIFFCTISEHCSLNSVCDFCCA